MQTVYRHLRFINRLSFMKASVLELVENNPAVVFQNTQKVLGKFSLTRNLLTKSGEWQEYNHKRDSREAKVRVYCESSG